MNAAGQEMETLLRPEEVAKWLSLGISTVYHLAHRGALPGIKIGGTLRFRPEAISKYLKSLEEKAYGKVA